LMLLQTAGGEYNLLDLLVIAPDRGHARFRRQAGRDPTPTETTARRPKQAHRLLRRRRSHCTGSSSERRL
jgi:hypothetical protein